MVVVVSLLSWHWLTPLWVLRFCWQRGNRNLRERNWIRLLWQLQWNGTSVSPAFQGRVKREGVVTHWLYVALCSWSLCPKQGKVALPALRTSPILLLWYSHRQQDLNIPVMNLVFFHKYVGNIHLYSMN